jgi:hypothetical protein
MAGPLPEGTRVGQLLDRFLAQIHSSLVHATGWTQSEEQAARQREEAARREEEARQAALVAAEEARAAAEMARRAAEAEATQARDLERRSTARLHLLEASLRQAEQRATEAEKRASTAPPVSSGAPFRGKRLALSALAVAGLSFAALMVWHGPTTDDDAPPAPVVESILPAEPSITTFEQEKQRDAGQGTPRKRPGR